MFRAEVAIRSGLMGPILRDFRLREALEIAREPPAERGRLAAQGTPRARALKGQAPRKADEAAPAAKELQEQSSVELPRLGRCGGNCRPHASAEDLVAQTMRDQELPTEAQRIGLVIDPISGEELPALAGWPACRLLPTLLLPLREKVLGVAASADG
jgi:hypothetical protein